MLMVPIDFSGENYKAEETSRHSFNGDDDG